MTSIEDKLQSLQNKVSTMDKTSESSDELSENTKSYNKYIYIIIVYFICLFILIWYQPSFVMIEEETNNKGRIIKTKKINKTYMGVCAGVMSGTVIGGWYWYSNKNFK